LNAGNARQVVEIERLERLHVAGHDLEQEIPFPGQGIALEHLASISNRGLEGRDRVAPGRREFHVGEYRDVESECGPVEQRHAFLDDAGFFQLLNSAPAGRRGLAGACRDVSDR